MANSESKRGACFNTNSFCEEGTQREESSEQEMIIDNLLGPGVTIIGSDAPRDRYVIQQQMAIAIAKGETFLGILETKKAGVLYVAHGPADYKEVMALSQNAQAQASLEIRQNWKRIEQGGITRLERELENSATMKVFFLGDFEDIRSFQSVWHNKYRERWEVEKAAVTENDPFANKEMKRVMLRDNIRRLRDLAERHDGISVVLGEDLNSKGALHNRDGLKYRNNELHIRKSRQDFRLEVRPGGSVLAGGGDLYFDAEKRLFMPKIGVEHKSRKNQAQEHQLLDNEKQIIDAVGEDIMSAGEIIKKTGIARATVYQRLDALKGEEKGLWILSFEHANRQMYMVNPEKVNEKNW